MSRKYKDQVPVYAIMRADLYHDDAEIEQTVVVKEVVHELAVAAREVERLNRLNGGKGMRYWWQSTRLYPAGSSAGTDDEPG